MYACVIIQANGENWRFKGQTETPSPLRTSVIRHYRADKALRTPNVHCVATHPGDHRAAGTAPAPLGGGAQCAVAPGPHGLFETVLWRFLVYH